jgi:hypothetical protein
MSQRLTLGSAAIQAGFGFGAGYIDPIVPQRLACCLAAQGAGFRVGAGCPIPFMLAFATGAQGQNRRQRQKQSNYLLHQGFLSFQTVAL